VGDTSQDTHVKRSSGTSYAMRWKHEHTRLIGIVSGISFVAITLFLLMLYGTADKAVTLVVDGKETVVNTKEPDVRSFLAEQAVAISEHDFVSAPLDSKIRDGQRLVVDHAASVEVSVDGETKTLFTLGKDVESVLRELKIEVGEEDRLSLPLSSPISDGTQLTITRVKREIEEQTEPIAYEVVRKSDPNLLKGKEQVVQDGQEGLLVRTIEKVYEDGELVAENVIDENVVQESVDKIIAVGTKNPVTVLSVSSPDVEEVTRDNVTFGAKQVLKNVTLTAYTAGPSSTGKSVDHPGYGITSSGARATEGRTIAVDPKVIPLGWWVYIEGIGFRRAEDTGGSVKGNKIDIFFDSESYARKFGVKRGYTVYVIGPKKPTAD